MAEESPKSKMKGQTRSRAIFARIASALDSMAKACRELANYNSDEEKEFFSAFERPSKKQKRERESYTWTVAQMSILDGAARSGKTKAEIKKLLQDIPGKEVDLRYSYYVKAGLVPKKGSSEHEESMDQGVEEGEGEEVEEEEEGGEEGLQ